MKRLSAISGWIYGIAFIAFLLLPILVILPTSFSDSSVLQFPPVEWSGRWYEEFLFNDRWTEPTLLSFRIAVGASLGALALGLMVAVYHARVSPVQGTRRAALLLPLLVPAVVIGSGLFSVLLRLNLLGRPWVLLIAHIAMALPFTVTILVNGVEEIDQSIWKAAASLGANLRTTVRKVIVPILAPSVIAAWVLAFMYSWDEVVLAVFVGPTIIPTLPARMFSYLRELINPVVAAASTFLLLVSAILGAAVWGLTKLYRRRAQLR